MHGWICTDVGCCLTLQPDYRLFSHPPPSSYSIPPHSTHIAPRIYPLALLCTHLMGGGGHSAPSGWLHLHPTLAPAPHPRHGMDSRWFPSCSPTFPLFWTRTFRSFLGSHDTALHWTLRLLLWFLLQFYPCHLTVDTCTHCSLPPSLPLQFPVTRYGWCCTIFCTLVVLSHHFAFACVCFTLLTTLPMRAA